MQTYNFRLTFTFISLSSLPTYNTDFSEKTKMGNICKISTYSEEWREGKVQRRKDGTGWEETTCAYLIMCLSLSKWKGINGRSFVTSQEVLVFGTFNLQCSALWKHTFVCSDSGPNSFQNKSLRKSHLSLRLNPIFRLPNTWNTWTIYGIRTHFLIQIRARFHTNPLQVARTILPSLTHTHTAPLTQYHTFSWGLFCSHFNSSSPSLWQRSVPKHNGCQQLVAWLTAKPSDPAAYWVI